MSRPEIITHRDDAGKLLEPVEELLIDVPEDYQGVVIQKLALRAQQDGLALVPLSLYFKDSRVKLELGLCQGKKLHDKRETEAKRSADCEIDRAMKSR